MLVATMACADEGSTTSEGRFEVVDSAGVAIVLNGGADSAPGEGSLTVVEDLRIGALESEREELLFQDIRDILLDESGRIYVGNDQTATVRVFDENGAFIREFGGRGEGPSEIPYMLNDLKWAADQIVVIDWQSGGKSIVYDTSGVFVESRRHVKAGGERIPFADYTPEGWVAVESEPLRQEATVPGQAYPRRQWMRRWSAVTESYEDTLFELPPSVLYGSTATHGLDWGLFGAVEGSGFDAEGNYYRSAGKDYRIDIRNPGGQLVRSVRREYDPIPISDEDVEEYRNRMTMRYDTMTGLDEARRREQFERMTDRIDQQAGFPRPETRPPLGTLLVAHDGSFWVERLDFRQPAEWFQSVFGFVSVPEVETSWDIFSSDGRFRGNVILPPRFSPMAVSSTYVVGVARDDFDVEYVARYRVAEEVSSRSTDLPSGSVRASAPSKAGRTAQRRSSAATRVGGSS